jgi:hypothetical protein
MTARLFALLGLLALGAGLAAAPRPAAAAPSHDGCTGFIDAVGTVVSTPGTWCLRQDLATSGDGDHAITIAADDVVVDCNGHAIRFAGGPSATRTAIRADDRLRVTVRQCVISGFRIGVALFAPDSIPVGFTAGFVVEDNVVTDGGYIGIRVDGRGSVAQRNHIARLSPLAGVNYVAGIYSLYGLDIRDNFIEDIAAGSTGTAYGVLVAMGAGDLKAGETVKGNRIRGLSGGNGSGAVGIKLGASGGSVSGNDLFGDGVMGVGVVCYTDPAGRVRVGDNIISGFPLAINTTYCADLGTNDVSP